MAKKSNSRTDAGQAVPTEQQNSQTMPTPKISKKQKAKEVKKK